MATKIDEYEPVIRPTSSASAKSSSVTAPSSTDADDEQRQHGRTAAMLVFSERISTWFIDRLTMSA